MITLEEAIQWCIEHCVEVAFCIEKGEPLITIYTLTEFQDDAVFLGQDTTLIKAVQEARRKEQEG